MNTQFGTLIGYKPQFQDPATQEWKLIEFKQRHYAYGAVVDGIPPPAAYGGILSQVWLCGEAQAWTIAWSFAASYAATQFRDIKVRVISYNVKYNIEWEPMSEEAKPTEP